MKLKRIAIVAFVLTITMASACWADDLSGVWKLDSMKIIELVPGSDKLDVLQQLIEDPVNHDEYITVRSDGAMVVFKDLLVSYDLQIGKWYQCTPDTYIFQCDLLGNEAISFMQLTDGQLKYRSDYKNDAYIEMTYIKVKEE